MVSVLKEKCCALRKTRKEIVTVAKIRKIIKRYNNYYKRIIERFHFCLALLFVSKQLT